MRPSELLRQHRAQVRQIALRYGMQSVAVFGSTASGTDCDDSDLDLLVEPQPTSSSFDLGGVQFEVSELLGIAVDVVTPDSLPPAVRARVLNEAVPL